MIFRKNILEIRKEYKDLKIKNEDLEMYDEVNKIYEKSEKDNEKIGEKRDIPLPILPKVRDIFFAFDIFL